MKSTDMFLSAEYRRKGEKVILCPSVKPKGDVLSAHVVSLWNTKAIPDRFPRPESASLFTKSSQKSSVFTDDFVEASDDAILWRKIISSDPAPLVPSVGDQIAKAKTTKKEYLEQFDGAFKNTSRGFLGKFW